MWTHDRTVAAQKWPFSVRGTSRRIHKRSWDKDICGKILRHSYNHFTKHLKKTSKIFSILVAICPVGRLYNFGKIIKTVATRCHSLKINARNSISTEGAYSAPSDPLAGLRGLLLRGRRKGKREWRGSGVEGVDIAWRDLSLRDATAAASGVDGL